MTTPQTAFPTVLAEATRRPAKSDADGLDEYDDLLPGDEIQLSGSCSRGAVGRSERGMVTAEYAVGILAAIALAMVLVRVFNDKVIDATMLEQVTRLIGAIGAKVS